jgi:hypothetical protein
LILGRQEDNNDRIRRAHSFFVERETSLQTFTKADVGLATGWKPGTVTSYLSKKWSKIVRRDGSALRADGVARYTADEFVRLMSQKDEISADPRKPQVKPEIEMLLRKAREAALLALQIYNNPTTCFRTEGFSVMMVIAWTALFHAIFEKRGQRYFHLDPTTQQPVMIDGDEKAWELAQCAAAFFGSQTTAVRKNLEFFIRLRNKVEHRYVPEIDPHVVGECQAMLLNFDDLLVNEFGTYFAVRESLAVPLQTAHVRTTVGDAAMKRFQAKNFEKVRDFVNTFRADLPGDVLADQRYCLRVFLLEKPANHQGSADHAIEFVKVTPENRDKLATIANNIVALKDREVHVANAGHLKPSDVAKRVAARIAFTFNTQHHAKAWKHYQVHPPMKKGEKVSAVACQARYCIPDEVHNDYVYTPAWVDFLVKKLSDPTEYQSVIGRKPTGAGPAV